MNHPVWCIWCLQQNQQPPLGFFTIKQKTKSNSSFRVLLRKVMDHYRVRCPSIFSHIQAICLCVCCITTNEKTVFFFFQIALLLRLWLQLRLTFIICVREDLFNVTVFFQAKRKAAQFSRVFTTNACKLLPKKKSCTFQQASCFHVMDEPANVLNCCIFTCAWFIH